MADERRLDQVILTVDGRRLEAELYQLLSLVRVEESVHLPDAFTLRFDDPHFELFDKGRFSIGSKVDIAFAAEGDPVTVTRGEVTAMAVEQGGSGHHELAVTGFDATHRLAKGPKTKSFLNVTDADIVGQIAADLALTADVDATSEVHEYVIQSSQSDYAFLRQRAERIGFDLWVADGKLFFKKSPRASVTPPVLKWGSNLHRFKARFSSTERCDEVTIRGWDPVAKRAITGRATEGDPGATSQAVGILSDSARKAFGRVARFAGQHPVHTQAEADALARSLLLKASGDEVMARGEALGDPLIAAGAAVEVASMGERLSGTYRITSVEHIYGGGSPYLTRFVCGGKDPSGLADLMGAAAGGSTNGKRGWGSLVIALVTNCDDPESLGRVKVSFPTLSENDESAWARVVSPGAGKDRGFRLTPEVGDEVLVGFEHDDKRRPIVLGGMWSSTDMPPPDALRNGAVVRRKWVSRTGHKVEMVDDSPGNGMFLELEDGKSSLKIEPSGSVLEAENSATIHSKKITLRSDTDIVLDARNIKIKASEQVTIKGARVGIN